MCDGVYYSIQGRESRVYFPNPRAALPVRNKSAGTVVSVAWGRRPRQAGHLPLGGNLVVERVRAGEFDRYFPKSVLFPIKSFCLRDFEGRILWYSLTAGQWIHGAYLREGTERRVYILVLESDLSELPHALWPKIVSCPN